MQKLFIVLIIFTSSAYPLDLNPFKYIQNYLNEKIFVMEKSSETTFKSCEEFTEEEKNYYVSCNNDTEFVQNGEIDNLAQDMNAISVELLKEDFLVQLNSKIDNDIQLKINEAQELIQCLQSESCQKVKEGFLNHLRSQLPKMRVLMAQMNMPGKIYSPTRPLRYHKEIKHDLKGSSVPPLSTEEEDFIREYTWNLEDDFSEMVKIEHPEFKDSKAIIDSHVTKKFEAQNKVYHRRYKEIVSQNPLLMLVEARGDENDDDLINEALKALDKVQTSLLSLKDKLNEIREEEPERLIRFQSTTNELLQEKSSAIYCDVANDLNDSADYDELKEDLMLTGAMLVGGSACAFSFGLGCVLGVAVAGETYAITSSLEKQKIEEMLFLSSESSVDDLERRNFDRDLTIFLAPLSLVGEGAVTALKRSYKTIKQAKYFEEVRRIDLEQRKIIDDLKTELGDSDLYYNQMYNSANFYKLTDTDKTYFSGIVHELKKKNLSDEEIKDYLKKLVTDCKGGKF